MIDIFIRELWIYPVKSLGGVRCQSASVTATGSLALDREWVVVGPDGHKRWQGDIPKMTLVRVAIDATTLTLSLPSREDFVLPRDHDGPATQFVMYKQQFSGIDAGDAAAAWLSAALDQPLRLVRIGAEAHRRHDLNPIHVVADASLAALNASLAGTGNDAIVPMRFRPNVVLGSPGPADPWFEESNPVLDFGGARLRLREPCQRCEMPNISLVDASRGTQPLKRIGQLARHRPAAAPASFGVYCAAEGDALRVGMQATIP